MVTTDQQLTGTAARNNKQTLPATKSNTMEYDSFRQSVGNQVSIASHQRIVGDMVRDKLFAKVKFLSDDNELEYNGKKATTTTTRCRAIHNNETAAYHNM